MLGRGGFAVLLSPGQKFDEQARNGAASASFRCDGRLDPEGSPSPPPGKCATIPDVKDFPQWEVCVQNLNGGDVEWQVEGCRLERMISENTALSKTIG